MKIRPIFLLALFTASCAIISISDIVLSDMKEANKIKRENIMRQTIEALTMQNARLKKNAAIGRIALEAMPVDERDGINVPVGRCAR